VSAPGLDYPVALKLSGKPVLLVGGGPIAEGRLLRLLEVGASVHLVSPEITPTMRQLAESGQVRWSQRGYAPGDCHGMVLVFTATNDPTVSHATVEEARSLGILANAADVPHLCDFNVPSLERRGPVTIAVSTAGLAPGLSRMLRLKIAASVGPEYATLARLFGRLRRIVPGGPRRTRALQALLEGGAVELIAQGQHRALWRLIRRTLTDGVPEAFPLPSETTPSAVNQPPVNHLPVKPPVMHNPVVTHAVVTHSAMKPPVMISSAMIHEAGDAA